MLPTSRRPPGPPESTTLVMNNHPGSGARPVALLSHARTRSAVLG